MSEQITNEKKRPKGRSPSYPALNLEAAIKRAGELWEAERQHPAAVDTIVKHWGYRSLNGPASLTLAALKKFGLTVDEGTKDARVARVSDLAVDILANPDAAAQKAAIQQAALNPSIHRELWEKYGTDLPSDTNLKWELTRQRGFTETGAVEFIPQFRETIAFAQLGNGGTFATQTVDDKDKGGEFDEQLQRPPPHARKRHGQREVGMSETGVLTYAVPVAAGFDVTIEGRFPLTESEWTQFMAVLNAMKPGLVGNRRPHGKDENDDE